VSFSRPSHAREVSRRKQAEERADAVAA